MVIDMNELKESLLNALTIYKIFLQMDDNPKYNARIENLIKKIESCEDYINQGKEINDSWLKENHTILAKSIKTAHRHLKETSSDAPELRYVNSLMIYYKDFYRQNGMDFENL